MLRRELEITGAVALQDVEEAQQSIVEIAKNLRGEGKIELPGE